MHTHFYLPNPLRKVYITLTVIQPEEGKRIPTLSTVSGTDTQLRLRTRM